MRPTRTVIVAGAGIAGLTAAIALARGGQRAVVLERLPAASELGAGVQLAPNAGRLLADLGLDAALAAVAVEPEAIDVRSGRDGKDIVSMPLGEAFRTRYGTPYRVIRRTDLIAVLNRAAVGYEDIDLNYNASFGEFAAHLNGVTAHADIDGRPREFRGFALLAADGINSHVRFVMPRSRPAVYSGRTAWRAVVAADRLPDLARRTRVNLWLGPKAHLVHYPLAGGREVNIVAIVDEPAPGEGWSLPGDPDWLTERFAAWCEPATAIVAAPTRWLKWPINTIDPAGRWVAGPVALIGDAAHAMSPFLAQGAAMAIEDAVVIARELAAHSDDVTKALNRYVRVRRRRVIRVTRASRSNADLYHLAQPIAAFRDIGMRLLGGPRLLRRYHWLYGWKTV
jgi:salicylate hydroxylase